jgi:hypothetical protein
MRKSISGLMTLVKHSFSLDRCAEALFVYTTEAGNSFLFLVVVQILMYYTIYVYILNITYRRHYFNLENSCKYYSYEISRLILC